MNLVTEFKELVELHAAGALSDDEYRTAKVAVLESSNQISSQKSVYDTAEWSAAGETRLARFMFISEVGETLGEFLCLKVPFAYFREHRQQLSVRSSGDKFDLHISAKQRNPLQCERSQGLSYKHFLIDSSC